MKIEKTKLIYQKDEDGLPLYQHSFDLISSIKKYNWWNKTNIEYTTDESSFKEGDIFSGSVATVNNFYLKIFKFP